MHKDLNPDEVCLNAILNDYIDQAGGDCPTPEITVKDATTDTDR